MALGFGSKQNNHYMLGKHDANGRPIPDGARPRLEPKPFFRAALRNDGTYELLIYEEIGEDWWTGGGITAKSFKQELDRATGPYSSIVLRINSPGGDAFEGVAILNMLRATGKRIKVCVDGLAASAASIVAMAGDEIEMGDGAMMMIHNAWSICIGPAGDMQKQADALNNIDESIAQVYSNKTGLKKADVLEMMNAETWLTAADCVKQGFATAKAAKRGAELLEAPAPLAMARRGFRKALASFRNVPAQFKSGADFTDVTDLRSSPAQASETEENACLCSCKACKDGDCVNCSDTTCNDKNCADCPMQEERQASARAASEAMARMLPSNVLTCAQSSIPQLFALLTSGHPGAEIAGQVFGEPVILAMRHGSAALCLASKDSPVARVKGVIAPYNSLSSDMGGFQEEYQPGCFAEFLKTDDPRVLYNHNIDAILGRKSAGTARFWEEPEGLHYEADLSENTQVGRDMRGHLERGDVKESSAAFYIYQYHWEQRGDVRVRVIEKARLVEGSPHTFAAYGSATAEPGTAPAAATEADYEHEAIGVRLRIAELVCR